MMGHRGVRLGITYPEVTEMQVRAIFEAAAELIKEGKKAVSGDYDSGGLRRQGAEEPDRYGERVYKEVLAKFGLKKIRP